jgi:hypothetical protein
LGRSRGRSFIPARSDARFSERMGQIYAGG